MKVISFLIRSAGAAQLLMQHIPLNRQWMGIDITILALDPMRERLADRHGLEPSVDYQIEGYPTNMQEVQKC